MLFSTIFAALAALPILASATLDPRSFEARQAPPATQLKPKVFILSTFSTEAEAWRGTRGVDVFAQNVTVPGLGPLFPDVHCSGSGEVCQVTLGEGEINAALSTSALVSSPLFDLTTTYFLIAGISSINPKYGTLGSVTFARYAIQPSLQHELDARSIPTNFSTGYIPLGAKSPGEYPQFFFGTEVFELNDALRKTVVSYANRAFLNDSDDAVVYRSHYQTSNNVYQVGTSPPSVVECDAVTSDTWYSGEKIGESIENYVFLITNGTGVYCTAAQEDNAILAALLRGAVSKLVDFGRVVVMRSGSDFDREFWGQAPSQNLLWIQQVGQGPALRNIGLAGAKVVNGILSNWTKTFELGIKPVNYIGDIFGTLGGTPDFGLGKAPDTADAGKGAWISGDVGELGLMRDV